MSRVSLRQSCCNGTQCDIWKRVSSLPGVACITISVHQATDFLGILSGDQARGSSAILPFNALRHIIVRDVEHVQQLPIYSKTSKEDATTLLFLSFTAALQMRRDLAALQQVSEDPVPTLHSLTFVGCKPPPTLDSNRNLWSRLRKLTRRIVWEEGATKWIYPFLVCQPDEDTCAICLSEKGRP
jgi:hypothetical protein